MCYGVLLALFYWVKFLMSGVCFKILQMKRKKDDGGGWVIRGSKIVKMLKIVESG